MTDSVEGVAGAAESEQMRHRWMMPVLIFAVALIVTVEFLVVGLLPILGRDLGVPLEQAAWLVSAFAVSAAVLGPAATLLAQAWPPRPVLAASLAIFAAAGLVSALVPLFPLLLAARVVQGALLTLFVSLASAEAAALATPARAGRAIGQVNLGVVVGTVFLVPLAVALADLCGWRNVFAGLGGLALVAAGLVRQALPVHPAGQAQGWGSQTAVLRSPRFVAHLLLSAVLFTAMFAAYSYIAAYLEQVLLISGPALAAALLGFGLAGLGGNWLAMQVVDRDPLRLSLVVIAVLVAATAALPLAGNSPGAALLPLAAWGAAHTAAFVACQVRVMAAAPAARAFAASLNISVCNLGIAAGAVLGGWIVAGPGIGALWAGPLGLGLPALVLVLLLWRRGGSFSPAPCGGSGSGAARG